MGATLAAGMDHHVHVNGLRLHYRDIGDPTAPPVVMLHGIMGHAREWDVLVDALATQRRVLVLDQRGHGESDHAADYTYAALADDITRFLAELRLAGVALIGHSMGGLAASLCAADRPDLVDRLVVIDISPDSIRSEWARRELPAVLATFAEASYADEEEAVAEWLSGDPLAREPFLRHYVRHALTPRGDGRLVWRFDAANLGRLVTDTERGRLWSAVDRIAAPTLLIRGEHSHLLPETAAAEVVRRLRDGRLVEIPGGGHDLGVQQPEAIAVAVRAFLSS